MIPLWMFPLAVVTGNTMILKPSEQDPGACMMLVELAKEAGIPDGVVNVIHGQHEAVNFICDSPAIRAISFVGSDQAGKYIYERGSKNGKRVQSNMGAKNHGVIMPDASKDATLNQVCSYKTWLRDNIFLFLARRRCLWCCWTTLHGPHSLCLRW